MSVSASLTRELYLPHSGAASPDSIDITGDFSGTALQHAAMQGYADVVRELLRHNPDLSKRDPTYDGDALGWALHGADNIRRPGADYAGVVEALLAAGLQPRRTDYTSSDRRVAAVLKRRGLSGG